MDTSPKIDEPSTAALQALLAEAMSVDQTPRISQASTCTFRSLFAEIQEHILYFDVQFEHAMTMASLLVID